jgi:hypothetical protein
MSMGSKGGGKFGIYDSDGGKVPGFALGGRVNYLATGGLPYAMRPNGTDTVPAMLTPGEVVIKRSSARAIGYEQLAYANATGRLPGGSSGAQATVNYNGPINVVDVNELMRRQDASRRDALAMLD